MKILEIDLDYFYYPQNISSLEDFISYVNEHYNSFIELTMFKTENCYFPYLVSDETERVFINFAAVKEISETEATVLCRSDYDARLEQVVKEKCINCVHYEEDTEGDNLKGHRQNLSLDGECWQYEPI